MSTKILLKRGNTLSNDNYTGSLGEVTLDTQARKLRIHDSTKEGGYTVANMTDVEAVSSAISSLSTSDISGLAATLQALSTEDARLESAKVNKTTSIIAGSGLSGGGTLSANRTITLGTPTSVTGSSTNKVSSTGHTHELTVTKSDVGLSVVDNTSDKNKPLSDATIQALSGKLATTKVGIANGVAQLDSSGKVPASQLPSYVDDVLEYTNLAAFPTTGEEGKMYVAKDNNKVYRWSGSSYIHITSGAVDSVAGKTGVVVLSKNDVGLSAVTNTSDANKPVSTAQQTALNAKANIASPTFTGSPKSTTPPTLDNTTRIATTAFVNAAISSSDSGVKTVSGTAPVKATTVGTNVAVSITNATTAADGAMSKADKAKLDGVETGAQKNAVTSVAGRTGAVVVSKSDVGLSSVNNYNTSSVAQDVAASSRVVYSTPAGVRAFIEGGDYIVDCGTL